MPTSIGSPKQSCPYSKKEEPEEKQDPKKHWIKFNIQDESGSPVPNVNIQVTLPDGSVEEKTSDANGIIEIRNIEPGTCKIESDWRELNVYDSVIIQ
jgi:hypothetical protein